MKKITIKAKETILQFLITCVLTFPCVILLSIDEFSITSIQTLLDYLLRCVLSTILIIAGFECFFKAVDNFRK